MKAITGGQNLDFPIWHWHGHMSSMRCNAEALVSEFWVPVLGLSLSSCVTLKVSYLFPLSPSFPTKVKIIITNF